MLIISTADDKLPGFVYSSGGRPRCGNLVVEVNVAHYSRLHKVVIDVPDSDHGRELEFWRGALGGPVTHIERYPEYHWLELPGQEFAVLVQHLQEGASRVHLDIHTDDLEAEVARLERLGAERVQQVNTWWVMRDPAGGCLSVLFRIGRGR